jgi:hypothetical protein
VYAAADFVTGETSMLTWSDGVPPRLALGNMIRGYWVSLIIHSAASMRLADHIAAPLPRIWLRRRAPIPE